MVSSKALCVPPRRARRFPTCALAATVVLFALPRCQQACASFSYNVGPAEIIYTAAQRRSLGLPYWHDGSLGVVSAGDGQYQFYGADGGFSVRTTGPLDNPGAAKESVFINGLTPGFGYVAGGPVYADPVSGRRLMIYHAERHFGGGGDFYSSLGMAVSTDASGLQFQDLGIIIEPNLPADQRTFSIDVGGGSFAVVGDHLHVYYRDYSIGGGSSELAVSRAPLSTLMTNAANLQPTPFTKYYQNDWLEPGRGGRSSPLEIGNPANAWSSVSFNEYLNQLVMVTAQWEPAGADLYMTTSVDGVNWAPRQPIAVDFGEQMYPNLIGTGPDPTRTGRSFFAYYTDSAIGAFDRWTDASIVRRLISLTRDDEPPAAEPQWSPVANFQNDFQAGGPAKGWMYAWSAAGSLGNSASYAPLKWSSAAGAYNTTGAATPEWNGHTQNDDYLMLGAEAGHPGRPGYATIAGYTIQPEDGEGLYRLIGSSILKGDGAVHHPEDDLDVSVYLNNSLVGSQIRVPVSGGLAAFDRDLGTLAIGDTVWVAVGAGANQLYDKFVGFDFTLQRGVIDPDAPPPPPPPPPHPPPPPQPQPEPVWSRVANYQDDFQAGGPAPGWQYQWSAAGRLGDAGTYAPLKWSESAGVYNTTGGATPEWSGQPRNEDYLMLGAEKGHPGRAGYAAIASYTIQAEDGDGLYRLVGGSIAKGDSITQSGEDGLNLSIFMNDTLLGPTLNVSPSGALATFSRDLGQLAIGDTVHVAVGQAGNQLYDLFRSFDFTLERGVLDPNAPPSPPPPPPPPPLTWDAVASFKGDFQTGAPAAGWKYQWSAAGRIGDASTYASLKWSESAGVYNTTGAATPEWNGVARGGDYLVLGLERGHPGRLNNHVIAGYTIQEEDGAGVYRIAGSSIRKADSILQSGEDGLDVAIFVNNKQIGAPIVVSTSGLLASFNRELGALSASDIVYVAIGSAGNQLYDLFREFDFVIEKMIPGEVVESSLKIHAVPEPSAVMLATAALLSLIRLQGRHSWRRWRQSRTIAAGLRGCKSAL